MDVLEIKYKYIKLKVPNNIVLLVLRRMRVSECSTYFSLTMLYKSEFCP